MPRTELRTEVEILAPPTVVYGVLTDFSRYHEWNPFLTSVSGKLAPGGRLSLELSLPEGSTYALTPMLERVTENEELRWRGPTETFPAMAAQIGDAPLLERCVRAAHAAHIAAPGESLRVFHR